MRLNKQRMTPVTETKQKGNRDDDSVVAPQASLFYLGFTDTPSKESNKINKKKTYNIASMFIPFSFFPPSIFLHCFKASDHSFLMGHVFWFGQHFYTCPCSICCPKKSNCPKALLHL